MHGVMASLLSLPAVAMALLMAAAVSGTAVFHAPTPGDDLAPVGSAAEMVGLLQGERSILWTAAVGSVSSYTVWGWPSEQGDAELGGGMVVRRPEDGMAGVISFTEKPMTLEFIVEH